MAWLCNSFQRLRLSHPLARRISFALLVFLLAFVARVHLANTGRLEYDEKDYAKAAVQYANYLKIGDWNSIVQDDFNYEHPGFFKLVYGLAVLPSSPQKLLDLSMNFSVRQHKESDRVVALRRVSVGFGSLAVFLLALANPLAGLFLAVHTFAVKYTSVIYLEALPMFSALLSLQAFSAFLKRGPGKRGVVWLILSAAALGITAASKYVYALIGVVILVYSIFWMLRRRRSFISSLALWGAASLLIFWAVDPYLWANPVQRLSDSLQFNIDFSQGPAIKYTAYPVWQPVIWLLKSMPQQQYTLTPFFLQPGDFWVAIDTWIFWLGVIGLPLMLKRSPEYFLWLVIGIGFLLVWSTKWPQYVMLVLPPLCLAAAYGVQSLFLVGKMIWHKLQPPGSKVS